MDIEFDCIQCGEHLSLDEFATAGQATCPSCGHPIAVPSQQQVRPDSQASTDVIYCSKCGQQNHENNFKCTRCGFVLHGPIQTQYVTDDGTLGGLIPYKNAQALWAYYLGILALIPFIGIPFGVAALIMGIRGLRYADLHEEAKGKVHAWIGIVLGALCAAVYTLLIVAGAVMAGIE